MGCSAGRLLKTRSLVFKFCPFLRSTVMAQGHARQIKSSVQYVYKLGTSGPGTHGMGFGSKVEWDVRGQEWLEKRAVGRLRLLLDLLSVLTLTSAGLALCIDSDFCPLY